MGGNLKSKLSSPSWLFYFTTLVANRAKLMKTVLLFVKVAWHHRNTIQFILTKNPLKKKQWTTNISCCFLLAYCCVSSKVVFWGILYIYINGFGTVHSVTTTFSFETTLQVKTSVYKSKQLHKQLLIIDETVMPRYKIKKWANINN